MEPRRDEDSLSELSERVNELEEEVEELRERVLSSPSSNIRTIHRFHINFRRNMPLSRSRTYLEARAQR